MPSTPSTLIAWLGEPDSLDSALVGGKSANLSRLASTALVPPGFCLTVEAHALWARSLRQDTSFSTPEGMADAFVSVVQEAHAALGNRCQASPPVLAVRSSGVDEDGGEASFAGLFQTCLNVRGVEALLQAITRCWLSAEDARVLEYRSHRGLARAGLAVLVQEMVPADASAVVFSRNPAGSTDEILINATFGIGESLVSGTTNPDTWVLRRSDLSIRGTDIGEKATMTVPDGEDGTREVPVLRTLRRQACLTPRQVDALAHLALKLEATMGWPVDLECAFRHETLYLLQCRPITTGHS